MSKWGSQNRYQGYRGRGGGSAVLKVLIVLLAVLLLAGIAFLIYMGEYMEFTENGAQFRPPWLPEETAPPPIQSDSLVVVDPVIESTQPTATPEPPQPEMIAIQAVEVTAAQLKNGSAAQLAADAAANALVVEMKDLNGKLAWQSQAELAARLGVNAADNSVAEAVSALAEQEELYLVARIQCFRDLATYKGRVGTLMTKGGNVWYDAQGICWTSPAHQETVDYLTALCLELAAMGFDEIVLDSSGYPDFGEVSVLATGDNRPEDLTAPVSAFYKTLTAALADTGVHLSVRTTENALRGDNTSSGVTAGLLARYAYRVWLPAQSKEDTNYAALLSAAGMEDAAAHLVVSSKEGWATPSTDAPETE